MKIAIAGSLPRSFGIDRSMLRRAAAFFARRSRLRVPETGTWHEVEIHLLDDKGSDELHRLIMNIAGATDVITQAYAAIPPEERGIHGELFVNAQWALRRAPKREGWSPAKELLLYIAHGMDHLSGADDTTPEGYRRMRRRELAWLKKFLESEKTGR